MPGFAGSSRSDTGWLSTGYQAAASHRLLQHRLAEPSGYRSHPVSGILILVFNSKHQAVDVITEGLVEPGGMAIDMENRFLYVADVNQDQVLVYDADTLKLKRRTGTGGQKHALTTPGDFARSGGLAVDSAGTLYVADTLNNRIEIFDGDGKFISTFGEAGGGPG